MNIITGKLNLLVKIWFIMTSQFTSAYKKTKTQPKRKGRGVIRHQFHTIQPQIPDGAKEADEGKGY